MQLRRLLRFFYDHNGGAISHLITDDGLDPVCQIRHEHSMGKLTGRDGLFVLIDRFQNIPVTIDMQVMPLALEGESDSFGGTIIVADSPSKGRCDPLACRVGERFARNADLHRVNVQPTSLLFFCQYLQGARIPTQDHRLEAIKVLYEDGQRSERRKDPLCTCSPGHRAHASSHHGVAEEMSSGNIGYPMKCR